MSTSLTGTELDAVRQTLLDAGVEAPAPLRSRALTGGRSNLTYVLGDGQQRWVLRMPPRHGRTPSAHDVAREHRVTSGLHGTAVPVPEPVLLCEDESVLGAPFAISRFVDGLTLRSREDLLALSDATLETLVTRLVETLACLHRVDPEAVGLGGLGRADGYAERQLKRWVGQWGLVGVPAYDGLVAQLSGRLGASLPRQPTPAVVHGDFRIDNALVSADEDPRVRAVVDWELSTLGDPVADVALMCTYRHPALDLILDTAAAWASPRMPSPGSLASRYETAGGRPLRDWEFHLGLAHLKLAVIAAGIGHRHRASASTPGSVSADEAVGPLLEEGLRHLEGRG